MSENTTGYGTYLKPFEANSQWNLMPLKPVLGTYMLPPSAHGYNPIVGAGEYSTGVFLAKASDPAQTVVPLEGRNAIWEPSSEQNLPSIAIPHWPAAAAPATGPDGHCDIVDEETGIVHSFWQLRKQNGKWAAEQYAWSRIDGTGWGDAAHHYQGARAAAVPTMAGLIRKHEINDGDTMYRHALAMSLPYEALADGYIYPATSSDETAGATKNTGQIKEGALMMLPADYDTSKIANVHLRKVAETLKTYGAYVVDRNYGTPYFIYVEDGAGMGVAASGTTDPVYTVLHSIRAALRQVVGAAGWFSPAPSPLVPPLRSNLLSMRGTWNPRVPGLRATYNMYDDTLEFPATTNTIIMENFTSLGLSKVNWALLKSGDRLRFSVKATNGALGRIQVFDGNGSMKLDGPVLLDGQSCEFTVPWGMFFKLFTSNQNSAGKACSVSLSFEKV